MAGFLRPSVTGKHMKIRRQLTNAEGLANVMVILDAIWNCRITVVMCLRL